VIGFASCIASRDVFLRRALPGLREAAEADSPIAELSTSDSIFVAYNEALDHFAGMDDLEALVLLHEDAELLQADFCTRVRSALADPAVAIVGAVGARDVRSLAWWDGELAGAVTETRGRVDHGFARTDVDAVDGLLLVLSPWAVRRLRFDAAGFTGFHGYDVDLCFQARAAGRAVRVADLPVLHHTKGGLGDADAWRRADATFRAKWRPGEAAAGRGSVGGTQGAARGTAQGAGGTERRDRGASPTPTSGASTP
jgi:hypothetical protein